MKLRFNLGGILTTMEIKGYTPSKGFEWDHWCRTDYSYVADPWLNRTYTDTEIFMPHEIETLVHGLKMFLSGEVNEVASMNFIEPDFSFIFYPPKTPCASDVYSLFPSFPSDDIELDWRIRFWHMENGLTDNYLSMRMYRPAIEALLLYLRFIIGEVDISDKNVQKMIRYGYFMDP